MFLKKGSLLHRYLGGLAALTLVAFGAGGVGAATAHAATAGLRSTRLSAAELAHLRGVGKHPHLAYRYGKRPGTSTASPAKGAQSTNPACPGCDPPLAYQGGPVMGGISGTPGVVTITPIYWADPGHSFPASYTRTINQYLTDIAAASNTSGNAIGVNGEYYQNPGTGNQYVKYQVTAGSELDVSDPYPAENSVNNCTADPTNDPGYSACVADPALETELQSTLFNKGLPADDAHLYMVFFPPGVLTCEANGATTTTPPDACSDNVYCGYHSWFVDNNSNLEIYANMPFAVLQGCGDPFNGPQGPNGDPSADAEISVISHEASESITDPLVGGGAGSAGWADVTGNEIGDECAFTYGVPLGPNPASSLANGIAFNQVVNGHHYYIQDEFSNAAFGPGAGDVNTPTPTFFGVPPNQFQASPIQVAGCVQRPNGYQSLTPVRLFDTRTGLGGVPKRPVAGGTSISVQVAGVDGIPPDATAVALNVTGVNATAATYVTVWPDGASRPLASNLNFSNGNARPNFDVVSIGGDGKVDFFNAAGNINLLADIAGYYTTAAGYIPLTPVRLFDTRTGLGGVAKKPVAGGTFISVQVAGVDGIPPDATAVALNVTAVNATAATYVTAWPDGKPRPLASNLNVSNGNAIPNFDVVSIGGDGKVDFFNAAGSLNLLADIAGYYTQALGFNSLTPVRLFDTRTGLGGVPNKPVAGGTFISVQVAGVDGIPADATAVALNVTGVNATAATYVTVWPDAKPKPLASNLNFSDGNAAPNFDVVSIGTDGKVDFFNAAGSINLLADIAGYYR